MGQSKNRPKGVITSVLSSSKVYVPSRDLRCNAKKQKIYEPVVQLKGGKGKLKITKADIVINDERKE
jgi:hypothetical protein